MIPSILRSILNIWAKPNGRESIDLNKKPTRAQCEQVVDLMEATGIDLSDMLLEVFADWKDADVLALLPAELVERAQRYLEEKKQEQATEDQEP